MSRDQQNITQEKQFEEQVVSIDRVARVVKGGRRFRFRALVIVGDRKGQVGVGVSKGADVQSAISKAVDDGKKNMVRIKFEGTTIPHDAEAKVSGAHVFMKPASEGTGVIAGGVVRTVFDIVGIQDILSKSLGSSNKINCAYATVKALQQLQTPDEWITTQNQGEDK